MYRTTLILFLMLPVLALAADYDNAPTVGPAKGWLIIHGGGQLTYETKERFLALAGGPGGTLVAIPTALGKEVNFDSYRTGIAKTFGFRNVIVLHTTDRVRADSEGFAEPLRHASAVWFDGGRQYRLADAYLGTAVEREIKALIARGGVACGSSAGATIQGSFLVRGAPSENNLIMISPGHTTGFGLLPNSAIDQHVNTRGREKDLVPVIAAHPELLGIGLDQDAAIVVHGDSFFVVGGQVAIHDSKQHDGAPYFFLSSGQSYNMRARAAEVREDSPMTLTVTAAARTPTRLGATTEGEGLLQYRDNSQPQQHIKYKCGVSLYSIGNNVYSVWPAGNRRVKIRAREVNTNRLLEYDCQYQ